MKMKMKMKNDGSYNITNNTTEPHPIHSSHFSLPLPLDLPQYSFFIPCLVPRLLHCPELRTIGSGWERDNFIPFIHQPPNSNRTKNKNTDTNEKRRKNKIPQNAK